MHAHTSVCCTLCTYIMHAHMSICTQVSNSYLVDNQKDQGGPKRIMYLYLILPAGTAYDCIPLANKKLIIKLINCYWVKYLRQLPSIELQIFTKWTKISNNLGGSLDWLIIRYLYVKCWQLNMHVCMYIGTQQACMLCNQHLIVCVFINNKRALQTEFAICSSSLLQRADRIMSLPTCSRISSGYRKAGYIRLYICTHIHNIFGHTYAHTSFT